MQNSEILDNLVSMKRLPVLFVGSGFSKRYLKNYPTWNELLKEIASVIGLSDVQFEAYLQSIRAQNPELKISEVYSEMA